MIANEPSVIAQDVRGAYKYEGAIWSAELFLLNNTFHLKSTVHHNHLLDISRGYYLIIKDTLILFHQKQQDPTSSKMELLSHTEVDKTWILSMEVVNENNLPMAGVSMNLYSKSNNLLVTLLTDIHGKIENLCINNESEINLIELAFIGYKDLQIKLSNIQHGASTFKIYLKRINEIRYNAVDRIEKYLFDKRRKTFRLIDSHGELVIFSEVRN
jgi:hypothetical protein